MRLDENGNSCPATLGEYLNPPQGGGMLCTQIRKEKLAKNLITQVLRKVEE